MSKMNNIDLVYDFLLKVNKSVTLMEIWNGIKDEVINNKTDENESIADLYGEMVLDNKFALSANGQWTVADSANSQNIKAELKHLASHSNSHKNHDLVDNSDDDDLEIYDSLFIEEEEEETVQIFYDKDDED